MLSVELFQNSHDEDLSPNTTDMTLFGNKVIADEITYNEFILDRMAPNLIRLVS